MQNNTSAGLALFVTTIALLTFVYIAFMGIEYMVEGNHALAIALSLLIVTLLAAGISIMCKSKVSRNRRSGLPVEIAAILVTLGILFVGSIPFSHFLYVTDHEEELHDSIQTIVRGIGNIDSLYAEYAEKRVRDYRRQLYKAHYSVKKTNAMTASLRRRLQPVALDSVRSSRRAWISTLQEGSVWNISTPNNMHYITKAGEDWARQYAEVSSVIYKGEKAAPFACAYTASDEPLLPILTLPTNRPDARSLAITLVCGLLVLTTYLHIRRPKNKFTGRHR